MNEIINAGEMINRVFSNIEASNFENANKITSIWKKVVRGIKNSRDEYYGDKIASHSDVVDFKNGQLLIETDHPGWIQAIQLYSKFIIRGMNMNMTDLKVQSLVFRNKGNTNMLFNSYDEELKKAQKVMENKNNIAEKQMEDFLKNSRAYGANSNKLTSSENLNKNELPPEFLAKLASLESTVLTNSKNK
ncbi:MAG: DUF721 domain-containing protein [Clostridia bacterium]|nr:DUF721 domain-containing protein [Clostridia bacterium]